MAPRVLLIDDLTPANWLIANFLRGANFEVSGTARPAQALQSARATQPDVIVLDPSFAGHGGWELLAELKSDPRLAGIPTIVYTEIPEAYIADHAAQCQYEDLGYISKEDSLDHLLDRLADAAGAPALTSSWSA